ncbi:MAG: hypothetical protein ACLUVC_09140 [Longibaculum sp.]
MEEREILENLYKCKEACGKFDMVQAEIDKKSEPMRKLMYKRDNYKIWTKLVLAAIIGLFIVGKYNLRDDTAMNTVFFAIIIAIAYCFFRKFQMKKQIEVMQSEVTAFENGKQDDINAIVKEYADNLRILPSDYWYTLAVDNIIKYFEQKRASQVKEALALFDEQLHRWKIEQNNQAMLDAQREQARIAKRNTVIASAILGATMFRNRD